MKNLPNEVKIDIFKCLNFCQLNKARLLNKQFCALIDEFAGKLARKREVNRPPLVFLLKKFFSLILFLD